MSIFRPQQAASYCEFFAAKMASLARFASGDVRKLFLAEQRHYEKRSANLIRRYGIKCSSVTSTDRS